MPAGCSVEEFERLDTEENKGDDHEASEGGDCVVGVSEEVEFEFEFSCLPYKACDPDEEENRGHSVKLVVNHLLGFVDLKNKRIVDLVLPKHLDTHAS